MQASEPLKVDDDNVIAVSSIDKRFDEEDGGEKSVHCHEWKSPLSHQNQEHQSNNEQKEIKNMTNTNVEQLNDTQIQVRTPPEETKKDDKCDASKDEEGRFETDTTKCNERLTCHQDLQDKMEPLVVSTQESNNQQSNKVSPTVSETSNKGALSSSKGVN